MVKERVAGTFLLIGVVILFIRADTVPNVSTLTIQLLCAASIVGYGVYIFIRRNLTLLRTGTLSLAVLGLFRSVGYAVDQAWNPLGVWLIVTSLVLMTHFYLRELRE